MRILLILLLMLGGPLATEAQFEDIPKHRTLDIGITGDSESRSGSLTAVFPIETINGYFGIYGMHAFAKDEVVREVFRTRLQGGYDFNRLSIEGFIDTERNRLQMTDRETNIGYFIRPVDYKTDRVRLSGGIGNVFENTDARAELGLKPAEAINVPRWLAFASVTVHDVSTLITYTPDVSFNQHELEMATTYNITLRENLSLALNLVFDYDAEPIAGAAHTHTIYTAVMRLQF